MIGSSTLLSKHSEYYYAHIFECSIRMFLDVKNFYIENPAQCYKNLRSDVSSWGLSDKSFLKEQDIESGNYPRGDIELLMDNDKEKIFWKKRFGENLQPFDKWVELNLINTDKQEQIKKESFPDFIIPDGYRIIGADEIIQLGDYYCWNSNKKGSKNLDFWCKTYLTGEEKQVTKNMHHNVYIRKIQPAPNENLWLY